MSLYAWRGWGGRYRPLLKKLYGDIDTLQSDPDIGLAYYNNERTHQGKMCCERTPVDTLRDGKRLRAEKNLNPI